SSLRAPARGRAPFGYRTAQPCHGGCTGARDRVHGVPARRGRAGHSRHAVVSGARRAFPAREGPSPAGPCGGGRADARRTPASDDATGTADGRTGRGSAWAVAVVPARRTWAGTVLVDGRRFLLLQ